MMKNLLSCALVGLAALAGPVDAAAQNEHEQLLREIFDELIAIDTSQNGSTTTSYRLEVTNPGGHSSRPVRDNAIYHLAEGLARLADLTFPAKLTEVTESYFDRMSEIESGPDAADMKRVSASSPPDAAAADRLPASTYNNALLRTTCVAMQLEAGHAENALPQMARAIVNCCLIPGTSPVEVAATLVRVVANDQITVTPVADTEPSPPSPLRPDVMGPFERLTEEFWPGVPVLPVMSTGATDRLYFRNVGIPTYGVSGLFGDVDDSRAHGKDERIGVKQLYEGREFLYRLMKKLPRTEAGEDGLGEMKPARIKPTINIDVVNQIDARVGTIESVGEVEGSSKLVRLTVDFGDHKRTIFAGMKQEREDPTEIEGRQALFIVNLEPRKMMGEISEGMLFDVGYEDGVQPALLTPERPVPNGMRAG